MNYWYVAQEDELLIDCDSLTLLQIAMKRLCDTERIRVVPPLQVKQLFTTHSNKEGHYHLAVQLWGSLSPWIRMVWQLFLYDDVTRSTHNLFRVYAGVPSPSLLISSHNWLESNLKVPSSFWRSHNAVCHCESRIHKNFKLIQHCPAHQKLRGSQHESSDMAALEGKNGDVAS